MARVKFVEFIKEVSGKTAGMSFTKNRKGEPIMKKLPVRTAPLSELQKTTIQNFGNLQSLGSKILSVIPDYFTARPSHQSALNAFYVQNKSWENDIKELFIAVGSITQPTITGNLDTQGNDLKADLTWLAHGATTEQVMIHCINIDTFEHHAESKPLSENTATVVFSPVTKGNWLLFAVIVTEDAKNSTSKCLSVVEN